MNNARPSPLTVSQWLASENKAQPVRRLLSTEGATVAAPGVLAEVTMTTRSEDRARDSINPAGGRMGNFLANPVLLWAHDYSLPPVGRVGGVELRSNGWTGRNLQFTPREVSTFGHMIGQMYTWAPPFLQTFSIGMLPDPDGYSLDRERGGVNFESWEMLELSCCPVPMNPDCLVGAKSAGIDVGLFLPFAEKRLDGDTAAPAWLSAEEAGVVYRSLVPRMHAVPAPSRDMATLLAEVKNLGAQVSALQRLAIPEPKAQPAPAQKPSTTPEQVARVAADMLRRELAAITGRVTHD